jgi:hypothetical protein
LWCWNGNWCNMWIEQLKCCMKNVGLLQNLEPLHSFFSSLQFCSGSPWVQGLAETRRGSNLTSSTSLSTFQTRLELNTNFAVFHSCSSTIVRVSQHPACHSNTSPINRCFPPSIARPTKVHLENSSKRNKNSEFFVVSSNLWGQQTKRNW